MRRTANSVLALALLAGGLGGLLGSEGLAAQEGRDFLFGRPNATLTLNLGYGLPRAGSDLFQEIDTLLTLGRGDYRAPVLGGSVAILLNERLDLALDFSFSRSENWSEYVDWVEEVGGTEVPIEQKTTFSRMPVTASLRYYFMDRGRGVSRYAWVPARLSPYAGAGGGRVFYRFEQTGDFVDFVDNSVFYSEFLSSGGSWIGHLFAGTQVSASTHFVVTMEGRYSWASAELDRDSFTGYEPIDLSGLQVTMGVGVRF